MKWLGRFRWLSPPCTVGSCWLGHDNARREPWHVTILFYVTGVDIWPSIVLPKKDH